MMLKHGGHFLVSMSSYLFFLCYSIGTLKVITSNGCSKSISLAPVSFLLGHRACQRPEEELCPTLKGTWKASPPRMLLLWPRMRSPMRTSLTGMSFTNLFPEVCITTLSIPVNNLSSGLWVFWAIHCSGNELFCTNQSTAELTHMHMHVEPLMFWFCKQTDKKRKAFKSIDIVVVLTFCTGAPHKLRLCLNSESASFKVCIAQYSVKC